MSSRFKLHTFTMTFLALAAFLFVMAGCEKDDLVAIRSLDTVEPVIVWRTAETGGVIVANRKLDLVEFGVCYNTTPNPTVEDNIAPGTGLEEIIEASRYEAEFKSTITLLMPGTTYYIRAYVTTGSGTAYGNQLTFTTN
ncbi:MAG: hypothetical protein EA408_05240 [Marinilabiliales bacterium]|nr:MAG: hypothetical protein EA408_05240 [Marinilabiliales bacterium]